MKTKIGIILLNYYGIKDTRECLLSLEKISTKNIEVQIYLVNATESNKSENRDQGKKLKKEFPNIKVMEIDNLGFAGGHNAGTKAALDDGVDEVIWLNNDTTVHKDFAMHLHNALADKSVGAATPKIYFSKGREFHLDQYKKSDLGKVIWYAGGIIDWENVYAFHRGVDEVDQGQFDDIIETDYCTGCCIAVRKDVLEKVGLLEEKTFLYYEDTDWSTRVQKSGYKTIYDPSGIVWHKNAGSTKGSGSDLQVYYQTRNRIYFGLMYAPFRTKLALIKESVKKLLSGRDVEKKAVWHAFTNRYGKRYP